METDRGSRPTSGNRLRELERAFRGAISACDRRRIRAGRPPSRRIRVETQRFSLDDVPDAWRAQAAGPRRKLVIVPHA